MVRSSLIKFEPDYKHESKYNFPTLFKGFTIENVKADSVAGTGIDISGFDLLPVQDVTIRSVEIKNTPAPFVVKNARNINFRNVIINGDKVTYAE
jgi:hypothetical protein